MTRPCVVVAHPYPDLYGSDRQLLESLTALDPAAWRVVVVLPFDGPLAPEVRSRGHEVRFLPFPVLRKALMRPAALVGLVASVLLALPRLALLLRRERAAVLYVNTVTVPIWLLAARLARVPSLCHVHEAEAGLNRLVGLGVYGPLSLAGTVLVNSRESGRVIAATRPRLQERTQLLYNGIRRPVPVVPRPRSTGSAHLVVVGRLSERKGSDVAVAATRLLLESGREVRLTLVGDAFPGNEAFVERLREQVSLAGLEGAITFAGFAQSVWSAYDDADVVLVPSRLEPFGNVAVEALLSQRPVVASSAQGLAEIVVDGVTGVLVPPGDPRALADAVARLLDDPAAGEALAAAGRSDAARRFAVETYRRQVVDAVVTLGGLPPVGAG